MVSKEMLVPKLRFKKFVDTEAWQRYLLEELVEVNNGKDYKHLEKGDIPVYGTGGYMTRVNAALSYEKDAIGIGRKGTINKPYILKAPYWTVDTLFYAIPKFDSNINFVQSIFNNINWLSKQESTGVPSLSKATINNIEILIPTIQEQQEIGSFFEKIDEMIQLQQSKVNKVKDIKSAYLSEMFPKEGEKYPKKRFEGFTEPWIEYSLERLGDIVGGNSWKSNEYDKEGSHLIITIANVSGDYSVDINEGNKITPNNNRYVLSEGDILISMTGNVGRVSRMPEVKAVLNQRVGKLVINSGIDKEFIFTILQNKKFERSMILQGQGAAQLNISRTDILDYRFKIPEYNEQKKIGQLFKNINDQISVEEEKLMKLEKLKQAYLNDMFV